MSDRYFKNTMPDYSSEGSALIDSGVKLNAEVGENLNKIFLRLLKAEEANLEKAERDRSGSVYTGTGGLAYMYLELYQKDKQPEYLKAADLYAKRSVSEISRRDVSFLCGACGPLAVHAAVLQLQGKEEEAKAIVNKVLDFLPKALSKEIPDELLYGRVGYLYTLLFLKQTMPNPELEKAIKKIVAAVFASGQQLATSCKHSLPLLWEWYDEYYVGGAHGFTGIIYLLLQVVRATIDSGKSETRNYLMYKWHEKNYLGGAHGVSGILYMLLQVKEYLNQEQLHMIRQTINYLLTIRFPSGNFPSSLGSERDKLVHWCHGAPGAVQMLLAAYETWQDHQYLEAARACGDVVWSRGLLRKGCGICHGVAGNGYTFIALFQATHEPQYLHRAVQFAYWCENFEEKRDRPADRPYSLFEGLAGTVLFLRDIKDPGTARFPAFTIKPFEKIV